jgi:hypothetical protein
MPFLQEFIHKLEVGGGMRFFRISLTVLVLITVIFCYNWRAFRNMSTEESMDAAQLGRNISEGKGYTTFFIRPLSIYLLKKTNEQKSGKSFATDAAQLKVMHPDLANPPVYPVMLAGLMKVLPFEYQLPVKPKRFWTNKGVFYRYQPDFLIGLFNQVLFLAATIVVFLVARRLFDAPVAWLSAILILATELFWRFTVSGLPTVLLMLIFSGLVWTLVLFEQEVRATNPGPGRLFMLAGLAGLLVGIGGLTRYAFGWLVIPVVVFMILFGGSRRVLLVVTTLALFAGLMGPWIIRNLNLSGTPFGTATYAVLEATVVSPGNRLQRSLEPNFNNFSLIPFWVKLIANLRQIIQNDLPKLGGSWLSAFFLVGLLVGFRNPTLSRIRYFLLFSLIVLLIAQALGHTHLADDSPEINSENLLVIIAPIIFVYGIALFYLLLDQINFPALELRYLVVFFFSLVASLPMILVFLPPKTNPVAYPPYSPPLIQLVANWMKPSELTMSDVPWAMAWYGQRQAVWLTLKVTPDESDPATHEDFLAINDYMKPIVALYLTPKTMDARFFSEWISAGEFSWGSFILEGLVKKELPPTFPLHKMMRSWLPTGQLVLTDWERWSAPAHK